MNGKTNNDFICFHLLSLIKPNFMLFDETTFISLLSFSRSSNGSDFAFSQTESGEVQVVNNAEDKATEIKPIQFETQLDITDEELQKYLEELEEEEEEEKRKEKKEKESKASRPDSLNLRDSGDSENPGSQTVIPLRRNLEGAEGVE